MNSVRDVIEFVDVHVPDFDFLYVALTQHQVQHTVHVLVVVLVLGVGGCGVVREEAHPAVLHRPGGAQAGDVALHILVVGRTDVLDTVGPRGKQ